MDAPKPQAPDLGKGLPTRVRWIAVAATVTASVCSAFTYEGPYRWLAELQLALFGGYIVQLTFILTLIVCGVVTMGIVQLARRWRIVGSASQAEVASEQATAERLNRGMAVAQGPLLLLVAGAVFAFVGARDLWSAARGRQLQRIDAALLEKGEEPAGTWLELNGVLLGEGAVRATIHRTEFVFVPLVSKAWKPGMGLGALLKLPAAADPGAAPFRGAVDPEDLPGMVRAAYEKVGVDASHAVVLHLGKRPAEEEAKAKWFVGAGLIVASVAGVVLYRRLGS